MSRAGRRRVVAFDLGGVVVDVNKQVLAPLGPPDLVARALFAGDRHDRLTVGELSGEAFVAAVAADLGLAADLVRRTWADVVSFSVGGLQLVQDVAAIADVAIWSNTDPIHWSVLGAPLEAVAVDAATSFSLGAMKPQAAYFSRALQRLKDRGVDIADVVFIDDRVDNVAAAKEAGIEAFVVDGVLEASARLSSLLPLTKT